MREEPKKYRTRVCHVQSTAYDAFPTNFSERVDEKVQEIEAGNGIVVSISHGAGVGHGGANYDGTYSVYSAIIMYKELIDEEE